MKLAKAVDNLGYRRRYFEGREITEKEIDLIVEMSEQGLTVNKIWFNKSNELLRKLIDLNMSQGAQNASIGLKISKFTRIVVIIVVLSGIIIAFLFGVFIAMGISLPIGNITEKFKFLSQGDLRYRFTYNYKFKDEISELGTNFNSFIESLKEIVLHIKMISIETENIKSELVQNTDLTVSSIEQISDNITNMKTQIGDLDEKIEKSSSSLIHMAETTDNFNNEIENHTTMVTESSASITQMISSVKRVTDISNAKLASTTELVKIAETGRKKLDATNDVINDISSNIDNIQNMVNVINEIASQTNLLAMNASIEAAHAGEFGKGFAVVADEIRKLAENSAMNSKNIENLLNDIIEKIKPASSAGIETQVAFEEINKEVNAVVKALEEMTSFTNELSHGGEEVLQTIKVLSEVASNIKNGADNVSKESSIGSEHLMEIRNISKNVTMGMEEIAEGIGSINKAMNNISALSGTLGENTTSLVQKVHVFKTE